jgi:threonyl-tRNA synthetase
VSFRFRDGSQRNGVTVEEAIRRIVDSISSREQVTTAWLD